MTSSVVAEKWLHAALVADTTIHATVADRIYKQPAVAQPTYPCITFEQTGSDEEASIGLSGAIEYTDMEVCVVGQTEDDTTLLACADQIDALLADQRATYGTTTTYVFRVLKTGIVNEPTIEGTVRYLRLGGSYRFAYQGTT
jgi:hypothetical protein